MVIRYIFVTWIKEKNSEESMNNTKKEKEDCHCGLTESPPELACKLELEDAMKFQRKLKEKQTIFEKLNEKQIKVSDNKKKEKLTAQTLQLEREIHDLEKGMQLAFQRFAKCESTNPQVQSLNMASVEETLNSTWNMIVPESNNWILTENENRKTKQGKKKRK